MAVIVSILDEIGFKNVGIFVLFLLILILWYRSRRPVGYPPGPYPFPIIGNIHSIASSNILDTFHRLRQKHGDIFSLSLGYNWVIVVNGVDNLKEVLVSKGEYTSERPNVYLFNMLRNEGVIAASGPNWQRQRSFVHSKLREFGFGKRNFESSILEELREFLNALEDSEENFDFSGNLFASISNNVLSITIGRRFEYDNPKLKYIIKCMDDNAKRLALAGALNFLPFLAKLPGDPLNTKEFSKDLQSQFDYFGEEVNQHKENFDKNNPKDFIDVCLREMQSTNDRENNHLTEHQLEMNLAQLFMAGTETTATTIKWAILHLMHNVEIQNKMRREIIENVGNSRLPILTDKSSLPFCEAVIHETLRINNPVPFAMPHSVSEDIEIKGYTLPKNSILIPNIYSTMFDEELFPDSHVFNPERFIGSDGNLNGKENVIAFSVGRRVCLGESLARMELFLYLTSLIQRFEFLPPEGEALPSLEGKFGITYGPVDFKCKAVKI